MLIFAFSISHFLQASAIQYTVELDSVVQRTDTTNVTQPSTKMIIK